MTTQIVDYSYSQPSPSAIVAGGYIGAMRYLGNDSRCLTAPERDALLDHGLGIGLVWETSASRTLHGADAGREDAGAANRYADALGAPGLPIYYACDCDVNDAQTCGPVLDYYRAATRIGYGRPVRVYGEAGVIDLAATELGLRKGWQAAGMAWSNYRHAEYAAMLQLVGYVLADTSDANRVLVADDEIDWLWGGDMPLSPQEWDQLRQLVRDECANAINAAASMLYTGSRPVTTEGDPAVYELGWDGQGRRVRRHIPWPQEISMLQYVDQLAEGPVRLITEPSQVEAFNALPVVEPG